MGVVRREGGRKEGERMGGRQAAGLLQRLRGAAACFTSPPAVPAGLAPSSLSGPTWRLLSPGRPCLRAFRGMVWLEGLRSSAGAARTKRQSLRQQTFTPHPLETGRPGSRCQQACCLQGLPFGPPMAAMLHVLTGPLPAGRGGWLWHLFLEEHRAPPLWPHLSGVTSFEVQSPNAAALGLGLQPKGCWGDNKNSVHIRAGEGGVKAGGGA